MAYALNKLGVANHHGDMNLKDHELIMGDVFWVDSTSANAGDSVHHGQSQDKPFATLDYALTQTTTDQGDWIFLLPNHAETIALQNGIEVLAAMDNVTIAGVTGRTQDYPTITFEAGDAVAAADFEIDGAGTVIKRIRFVMSEDGCTSPIDVNAPGCEFHNCIFDCADTAVTVTGFVVVAAAAHNFRMIDCIDRGTDTAGAVTFLAFEGATNHVEIRGLQSHGDYSAANIDMAAALTDFRITGCVLENENAVDVNVEGFAACTGFFAWSSCRIATDGQGTWFNTPGNSACIQCHGNNAPDEIGMIIGTLSA